MSWLVFDEKATEKIGEKRKRKRKERKRGEMEGREGEML
jgi:hypothetical protein